MDLIKRTAELKSISVVVLSASSSDTEVAHCLATGANAFISKAENCEDFRRSIVKITDFYSETARLVG